MVKELRLVEKLVQRITPSTFLLTLPNINSFFDYPKLPSWFTKKPELQDQEHANISASDSFCSMNTANSSFENGEFVADLDNEILESSKGKQPAIQQPDLEFLIHASFNELPSLDLFNNFSWREEHDIEEDPNDIDDSDNVDDDDEEEEVPSTHKIKSWYHADTPVNRKLKAFHKELKKSDSAIFKVCTIICYLFNSNNRDVRFDFNDGEKVLRKMVLNGNSINPDPFYQQITCLVYLPHVTNPNIKIICPHCNFDENCNSKGWGDAPRICILEDRVGYLFYLRYQCKNVNCKMNLETTAPSVLSILKY